MKKSFVDKIPNFSDQNFVYASYICGIFLAVSVAFFIYEMFTTTDFGITVQWNIFKSAWFGPLFGLGVILAIINWGKFGHWSSQSYNVYKDGNGKKYIERNDDIADNMFTHILLPILGHFVIEPIIYACLIFYPLMCVFAILGIILPYVISALLIGIVIIPFLGVRYILQMRCRSLILFLVTFIVTGGLTWAAISMQNIEGPQIDIVETDTKSILDKSQDSNSTSTNTDDMFNDSSSSDVSDMFNDATSTETDDMFAD